MQIPLLLELLLREAGTGFRMSVESGERTCVAFSQLSHEGRAEKAASSE